MQDIDVAYLYVHADRELDVACAVKCIAEQHHDLRIGLAQWPSGMPYALAHFRPRVVILPVCYTERNYYSHYSSALLDWRRSVYFNLAWEQLLYGGSRYVKTPRGDFARNHVIHHAWGDFFASYLRERRIPGQHIFVNGNPAFALYDEPYRQYYDRRPALASRHHLDPNRRWVFFPENYNWGFYSDDRLRGFVQEGLDPQEMFAMRDYCRLSLAEVIQWCGALVGRHQVELIVRPRPNIPLEDFKMAVHQLMSAIPDRLHIIKDESVREWTLASDVVVSSYSTSLIEAAVAKKPAYLLEPYPIPASLHMDWHDLMPHIKTASEFESACLRDGGGETDGRLESWARTTMMARGDAIWNLAHFMAQIVRGEGHRPEFPSRKSVSPPGRFWAPKSLLFEYRRLLWRKKRQNAAIKLGQFYEKDVLGQGEIAQRIERWKHVLSGYDGQQQTSAGATPVRSRSRAAASTRSVRDGGLEA